MRLLCLVLVAMSSVQCFAQDIAPITTPARVIVSNEDSIISWANSGGTPSTPTIRAGDAAVATLTSSLFLEMKMGLLSNNIKWLHETDKIYVAGDIANIESAVASLNQKYRSVFFTASMFYIRNPTNTEFNTKRLPTIKRNRIIGGGFGEVVSWLENYEVDIWLIAVDGIKLPKPIVLLERKDNTLRVGATIRGGLLESYWIVNK